MSLVSRGAVVWMCRVVAALVLSCVALEAWAPVTTYTVTNTDDSGAGSLRQAILNANANLGAATIDVTTTGTITLASALPNISDEVTVNGNGITVDGDTYYLVFIIDSGVAATFNNLTIKNGHGANGGGIHHAGGANLVINGVTFYNNDANRGGAIYTGTNGTVDITRSTFTNNVSGGYGGAIFVENVGGTASVVNIKQSSFVGNSESAGGYGGAISIEGNINVLIEQSTFSNNSNSSGIGGAIISGSGAHLTIKNSTLTNNYAYMAAGALHNNSTAVLTHVTLVGNSVGSGGEGGGISNGLTGQITITNSIVSGNTGTTGPEISNWATLTSTGKNIFGISGVLGIIGATPDINTYLTPAGGLTTVVGSLTNNGGPTQTRAPVYGGTASNAGDNAAAVSANLEYDQRGGWRILDSAVDIGAVEIGTVPLNDTGITSCSNEDTNGLTCPVSSFPRQDAEYGSNGFDFTAIDSSGNATTPTTGTNPHPCVLDNTTGLIWEVKTDDGGLRDKDNTYT